MSKFEEKFKSIVTADKSEVDAKKSWNIVNSAFVAKLALLNSELTELQFAKADVEEKLESAKINSGEKILNRDNYLINLVNYKNNLTNSNFSILSNMKFYSSKLSFLLFEETDL